MKVSWFGRPRASSRGTHHADSSLLALMSNMSVKPHIMGQDAQGRDSCIRAEEAVMVSYALMAQSSRLGSGAVARGASD